MLGTPYVGTQSSVSAPYISTTNFYVYQIMLLRIAAAAGLDVSLRKRIRLSLDMQVSVINTLNHNTLASVVVTAAILKRTTISMSS